MVGTGLFTANDAADDAPPPGAGFVAITLTLEAVLRSPAVRVTLICVDVIKAAGCALPPTCMVVAGTNPVPVTTSVVPTEPVVKLTGDRLVIAGDGLFTVRFTAGPEPLEPVPFSAMTLKTPPDAI
jgi:hypothetical protein